MKQRKQKQKQHDAAQIINSVLTQLPEYAMRELLLRAAEVADSGDIQEVFGIRILWLILISLPEIIYFVTDSFKVPRSRELSTPDVDKPV